MSVILGFIILIMAGLMVYMAYRLIRRRKPFLLAATCLQLVALTIAIFCFINDVLIFKSPLLEVFLITAGIGLPAGFLVYDYIKMMKNVKKQGIYKGLVDAAPQCVFTEKASKGLKGGVNPPIKEYPVSGLLEGLRLDEEDLTRNIRISLNKAQLRLNSSDSKGAMEIYDILTALIHNCPAIYFNSAGIALRMGDYESAIASLKKALKLLNKKVVPSETLSDYHYNLGIAYYKSGNRGEALENFQKAASLNPDSCRNCYNLAVVLDESGNTDEAIKVLRKVISLQQDFVEAYSNLGILLSNQNRHHEALDIYRKGLEVNPGEYSLYYNMGITFSECMEFEKAEKAYRTALKLRTDEHEIYYYLGAVLVQLHKYNEAVETYKKALKVQPEDSELFYNIAMVYSLLQETDIAIDNLRKAIELNSELKGDARLNKAFETIRSDAGFKALVS